MKANWGPEYWDDKMRAQGPVSVIMGTGYGRRALGKNTTKFLSLLRETLLKRLPAGSSILDVGVGPLARFSIELGRMGYRMTGLDGSPATLTNAKSECAASGVEVNFVRADFSNFELSEKFDGLICIETFYHLPAHLSLNSFRSFNKVLKPGGYAFVQFAVMEEYTIQWLAWSLFYRLAYVVSRPILRLFGRKSFYVMISRISSAEVQDIAQRSGFEIIWRDDGSFLFRKFN